MKSALARWYYRPELPVGKTVKVGVWEDGVFAGVVVFGCGASDSLGTRYGITSLEVCEMVRIALRPDHKCQISRVLRIAISFLRKHCPGLRLVLTYADPAAGHTGAVYQAANWIYVGTTTPDWRYIDRRGIEHHSRNVKVSGWSATLGGGRMRCPKPSECTRYRVPGKHKYALPLDDAMRALVTRDAKPNPKKAVAAAPLEELRGASIDSDALGHPPRDDGATPIAPLH